MPRERAVVAQPMLRLCFGVLRHISSVGVYKHRICCLVSLYTLCRIYFPGGVSSSRLVVTLLAGLLYYCVLW